jgi:hypothetical protein
MGPLEAESAVLFLGRYKTWLKTPDNLYTISGTPVRDMTAIAAEATESRDGKSMRSAGHHQPHRFCSAT